MMNQMMDDNGRLQWSDGMMMMMMDDRAVAMFNPIKFLAVIVGNDKW
jgi:hypothetical protein